MAFRDCWITKLNYFQNSPIPQPLPLTFTKLNYFCINHGDHGDQRVVFKFEIIINVFVTYKLSFICILILWVYGNYTYFNPFSAGTVFIHQNLTSTDVRFWCIKTVSVLKGLIVRCELLSQIPFQVNRNVHIYKFIKISHNEQTNPYNVVLSRVIPFIIQ